MPVAPSAARDPLTLRTALLALLPVVMAAIVYYPVTRAYFYADDFVCMVNIINAGFLNFILQIFGGHILIVRNLIFYVAYQLFGFHSQPYYWMLLLTHLLNVWLFFRVVRTFTGSAVVACFGAALWGTSPLGLGTVGWYSVYGQVLVVTIVLLLLDQIGRRMERAEPPSPSTACCWYLLLLAGVTCFGVGIGVALVFPVALFLLLPSAFRQRGLRLAFTSLPLVVATFYFGFRRLYWLNTPLPMAEFILGDIAFRQHLPIVSMLWHLVAVGVTGLALGFQFVPDSYPDFTSRAAVTLYFAAVVACAVASDGATRRRILALLVLCIGAYGIIAIGRSNVFLMFKVEPWVSARQSRYQYAGTVPLVIVACLVLARAARWRWLPSALPTALLVAWVAFTTHAFRHTTWRVDERPYLREWAQSTLHAIDLLIDAQPVGQTVYVENEEAPRPLLGPVLGHRDFPGWAALFALTYPDDVVRGRPVRFIERHPVILAESREPSSNHRLADLLVPPAVTAQAADPE